MFIGTMTGMVSATTRPPRARATRRRQQVGLDALGAGGVDHQHVPVEDAVGGDRQRGHELGLARRRTRRWPRRRCPRGWCPRARRPPRHSASSSSRSAPLAGTGRPSPSLWYSETSIERPSAPWASEASSRARTRSSSSAVEGRPLASSPMDEAAQRRVADQEAGVHGEAAVERVEVRAEVAPRPVGTLARGRRRACPRPWPAARGGRARRRRRSGRGRSCSCRRSPW